MAEPLIDLLDECWSDRRPRSAKNCDPGQWKMLTDLPGWTVHDNVAHMIGTERMLLGEQPDAGADDAGAAPHVRNDIGKANEQWIANYRAWTTRGSSTSSGR